MNNNPPLTISKIPQYEPLCSSTIRGKTAVVIGLLLVGLTGFFWWAAWGELPPGVDRPNLPPNQFAAFTFCLFGGPGLFLLVLGLRDLRRQARRRREQERAPEAPWRWDYDWDPRGTGDIGLRQAAQGLLGWLLALAIVVPLNYVILVKVDSSFAWFGIAVLGIFDLILLLAFGGLVFRLGIQLWHGRARLRYRSFPLPLGERAELVLQPHAAYDDARELNIVLRCVEERSEARTVARAGGQTTQVSKIGLARHQDQQTVAGGAIRPGAPIELSFELPADPELRTELSATATRHWELLVVSRRPGIDYEKRFLLPVY